MKNYKKGFAAPLLIVIIAILIVGSGVYLYSQKKSETPQNVVSDNNEPTNSTQTTSPISQSSQNQNNTASSSNQITASVTEGLSMWTDKTGTCITQIKYPVISGLSNTAVQSSINTSLKKIFVDAVTNSQLTNENGKSVIPSTYGYKCDFYNNTSYKVTLNKNNILSIQYSYSTGYNGVPMHPYNLPSGENFDLSTGRTLSYSDIFKSDNASLDKMKLAVSMVVNAKYNNPTYASAYSNTIISSFWQQQLSDIKFYLTPKAVVFFDYEADPSIPSFSIDYSTINDILVNPKI